MLLTAASHYSLFNFRQQITDKNALSGHQHTLKAKQEFICKPHLYALEILIAYRFVQIELCLLKVKLHTNKFRNYFLGIPLVRNLEKSISFVKANSGRISEQLFGTRTENSIIST